MWSDKYEPDTGPEPPRTSPALTVAALAGVALLLCAVLLRSLT